MTEITPKCLGRGSATPQLAKGWFWSSFMAALGVAELLAKGYIYIYIEGW